MRKGLTTLFLALVSVVGRAEPSEVLCGKISIRGEGSLGLSSVERRLVCGDPENPPWAQVPLPQAQYWLRVFLQDRGYFFPEFELTPDALQVKLGAQTLVTRLNVQGIPIDAPRIRFRKLRGETLTPSLLDQAEKRYRGYLESSGYPCARAKATADAPRSELSVRLIPEEKMRIYEMEIEPVQGLDRSALTRYFAFEKGDVYNGDYLNVTTGRMVASGLVQSAYFSSRCEPNGAHLKLTTVAGPPRVVSMGFGVSTDRLASLRASWKNNRLGSGGSQMSVTLEASLLEQELRAESDYYLPSIWHRFFLHPSVSIIRRRFADQDIENYTGSISVEPTITWDTTHTGFRLSSGPKLLFHHTARGPGPRYSNFLTLESELQIIDHYYEFHQLDPQSGFRMSLGAMSTQEGVLSTFTAHRFRTSGEKLWNFLNFDPPWLVIGTRWSAATTFTSVPLASLTRSLNALNTTLGAPPSAENALADEFRHYLGGRSDLRGFSPRELPDRNGALTTVSGSLELRLTHVLPWRLDPLIFLDAGATGKNSFSLEPTIYLAPGLGMRWNSPIGAIRGTIAQPKSVAWGEGKPYGGTKNWQLYLSLGEEF